MVALDLGRQTQYQTFHMPTIVGDSGFEISHYEILSRRQKFTDFLLAERHTTCTGIDFVLSDGDLCLHICAFRL